MNQPRDVRALEARLLNAWRAEAGRELGEPWKDGVMDAIRAEAELSTDAATDRVVRIALIASLAAAALAALFFGFDATALEPSHELARLVASDLQGLLQLVLVL